MGLPVNKLICASNDNKVLYDFFKTGAYTIKDRDFVVTVSPSMDILISSNLERLLYHLSDTEATKNMMTDLNTKGSYEFKIEDEFVGEYATVDETFNAIKGLFDEAHYVMDTHTAVAKASYDKYVAETGDKTPNVVVSTASPYKFAKDVLKAIDSKYADIEPFAALDELEKVSGVAIPTPIKGIDKREVLHKTVIGRDELKSFVQNKLK